MKVIVLVVNALTHILTLIYIRITQCSMGKWLPGKVVTRHFLDKCGLLKTNNICSPNRLLWGKVLVWGQGCILYKVIIKLVLWLWLSLKINHI